MGRVCVRRSQQPSIVKIAREGSKAGKGGGPRSQMRCGTGESLKRLWQSRFLFLLCDLDRLGTVPAPCRISSRFVSRRTVSWRGSWSDHREEVAKS